MVDHLFLLAVAAIGWGLSLASYRSIARAVGWPLGTAQEQLPALTGILALASIAAGLAFAVSRGPMHGGLVIVGFGLALAVFWTGFLRVGAQSALILAPLAALSLVVAWALAATGLA